jgi:hypothetical protein
MTGSATNLRNASPGVWKGKVQQPGEQAGGSQLRLEPRNVPPKIPLTAGGFRWLVLLAMLSLGLLTIMRASAEVNSIDAEHPQNLGYEERLRMIAEVGGSIEQVKRRGEEYFGAAERLRAEADALAAEAASHGTGHLLHHGSAEDMATADATETAEAAVGDASRFARKSEARSIADCHGEALRLYRAAARLQLAGAGATDSSRGGDADTTAFIFDPAIARTLERLSTFYVSLGRAHEATDARQEIVALQRKQLTHAQLATAAAAAAAVAGAVVGAGVGAGAAGEGNDPATRDQRAATARLAGALLAVGRQLSVQGEWSQASHSLKEAVGIMTPQVSGQASSGEGAAGPRRAEAARRDAELLRAAMSALQVARKRELEYIESGSGVVSGSVRGLKKLLKKVVRGAGGEDEDGSPS